MIRLVGFIASTHLLSFLLLAQGCQSAASTPAPQSPESNVEQLTITERYIPTGSETEAQPEVATELAAPKEEVDAAGGGLSSLADESGEFLARKDHIFAKISPHHGIDTSSKVGRFTAQVKYGSEAAMPFSWQLSRRNQAEARGPVTTDMWLSVNKRCTNWHYNTHTESADYRFHSTLTKFNYCGDAPWTYHRPNDGYVVYIAIRSTFPVSKDKTKILTCQAALKLVN